MRVNARFLAAVWLVRLALAAPQAFADAQRLPGSAARTPEESGHLPAPDRALELRIAVHWYEEGIGEVGPDHRPLSDTSGSGEGVEVGVGYRVGPRLALGVFASVASLGPLGYLGTEHDPESWTAGVQAEWHFEPSDSEVDPWVSVGAGWREYRYGAGAGAATLDGVELARIQLGLDLRLSPALSLGPLLGADASILAVPSSFVFAGLLGRLDFAPSRPPR